MDAIAKYLALLLSIVILLTACIPQPATTPIPMPTQTLTPMPTETPTPAMDHGIIQFSGSEWEIRDSGLSGPGPNLWDRKNVWLDENGDLHLKITHAPDGWHCAEVTMTGRL